MPEPRRLCWLEACLNLALLLLALAFVVSQWRPFGQAPQHVSFLALFPVAILALRTGAVLLAHCGGQTLAAVERRLLALRVATWVLRMSHQAMIFWHLALAVAFVLTLVLRLAQLPQAQQLQLPSSFFLFYLSAYNACSLKLLLEFWIQLEAPFERRPSEKDLHDRLEELTVRSYVLSQEAGCEAIEEHMAEADACAICLGEYKAMDCVRRLRCGHAYHSDCIKNWILTGADRCPLRCDPSHTSSPAKESSPTGTPESMVIHVAEPLRPGVTGLAMLSVAAAAARREEIVGPPSSGPDRPDQGAEQPEGDPSARA